MKFIKIKFLKDIKSSNKSGNNKTNETCEKIFQDSVKTIFLWTLHKNYGLRFLQIFPTICFVVTNLAQVIALCMAQSNRGELIEGASVFTFCTMGMLKQMSLFTNAKSWQAIIERIKKLETKQLEQTDFNTEVEYESDSEQSCSEHINVYTKRFKSMSTMMFRIYASTCFLFVISPCIECGMLLLNGKKCADHPHILPVWSPLDRISVFGYYATIFSEAIAAFHCVNIHIVFDTVSAGIIIFICGQFDYLRRYCERIGGNGDSCLISEKRDARALHRIKESHYLYGVLVETIKDINKLVKNILGIYFAVAAVTLCFVAVQLVSETLSVTQLVTLFLYMLACTIQLFLLCSFGNNLYNSSSIGMGEGPYGAAYWCLSPKVRRQLLLLGKGIMGPHRLQAGAFFSLDMRSFIQVIRTAYSYYAVIREKTQ